MGRFIAPSNPYEEFEIGCVRVYYPEHPLLFAALAGQLYELGQRYRWDTGDDIDAADKLGQDWLEAIEMTLAGKPDGCPPTDEECQQIVIDLTVQLNECQQQLQEYETMEINVTCGCCDSPAGDLTPTLLDPAGDPITTSPIPVDPNSPFDEQIPTFDTGTQTPPAGWANWQDFVDARCLLANYWIDLCLEGAQKLDDAENAFSAILDIVAFAQILLPNPISTAAGFLKIMSWVSKVGDIVDEAEGILDWVQVLADGFDEVKEELVCAVANTSDLQLTAEVVALKLIQTTSVVALLDVLNFDTRIALQELLESMIETAVGAVHRPDTLADIPASYVPEIDCNNCSFADIRIQSLASGGVVAQQFALSVGGSAELTAQQADGYGPFAQFRFVDDLDQPINVDSNQFQIVALSGWVKHNIPQHPFTIQSKNSDGSGTYLQLAANQNIPLPWVLSEGGSPVAFSIVELASAAGTDGFTVTIQRLY